MPLKNTDLRKFICLGLISIALPLSACAGGGAAYQPIVDGPLDAKFQQDLQACQNLGEQRNYNNADARTNTVAGAVLGGVAGLLQPGNRSGDLIAGAAVGGTYGAGGSALATRTERKNIVKRCMIGRGHRVLG